MAVLQATNPTYLDWMQSMGNDHPSAVFINQAAQTNQIIPDMTFMEGSELTGTTVNMLTGVPESTFRKLYQRKQPGKVTRSSVREAAAMMDEYAVVDYRMVEQGGNVQQLRAQEAIGRIESMTQKVAKTIFYGNLSDKPEELHGLANRYSSKTAKNGKRNIIDAGGTGSDNRSIWLIGWGPTAFYGFVPKGSTAGIVVNDENKVTETHSNGYLTVYRNHFAWTLGIALADWRYVVRVANIDLSDLKRRPGDDDVLLPDLMKQALRRVPRTGGEMIRYAFYMSADVLDYFEAQLSHAVRNSTLTWDMVGGVETQVWGGASGLPLRQVDQLEVDEARVT